MDSPDRLSWAGYRRLVGRRFPWSNVGRALPSGPLKRARRHSRLHREARIGAIKAALGPKPVVKPRVRPLCGSARGRRAYDTRLGQAYASRTGLPVCRQKGGPSAPHRSAAVGWAATGASELLGERIFSVLRLYRAVVSIGIGVWSYRRKSLPPPRSCREAATVGVFRMG